MGYKEVYSEDKKDINEVPVHILSEAFDLGKPGLIINDGKVICYEETKNAPCSGN